MLKNLLAAALLALAGGVSAVADEPQARVEIDAKRFELIQPLV